MEISFFNINWHLDLTTTRRRRGKLKKYRGEMIRQDMAQLPITKDTTLDRRVWRTRIRVES